MFKLVRRWWHYVTAKLTGSFNARADPKVQLEQAIMESQNQHRVLTEQAANVIAQQKQNELRLNRKMDELEKSTGQARQAVLMADEAAKRGDATKAQEYTVAAQGIANKLVGLEHEIEDLKQMSLHATQASDQAKQAVQANASRLQKVIADKQKLVGQLEQAKMQEQLNKAMASLSTTVGDDVPSFDEIRDKIESRYAKAKGMSELNESSVESRMLEIEQAASNTEASARLEEIRSQLGLAPAGSSAATAVTAPTAEPQAAPGT